MYTIKYIYMYTIKQRSQAKSFMIILNGDIVSSIPI